VEQLIDEENKEVAKVQEQFASKRVDFYNKRNKLFEQIPHFWSEVVLRSPVADFLNDDDMKIMEYLSEVKFFESSNPRITLCFRKNPYFSNTEIVKSFRVVEDGLESQEYTINWLPGQNIAERSKGAAGGKGFGKRPREHNVKKSFFLWFTNEASFDENSMVDAIRELYQYPIIFFTQDDGEDQDGYEEGAPEEEDGEEEEEDGEEGDYDDDVEFDEAEGLEEESNGNGRSVSPMLKIDSELYSSDGNGDEDDGGNDDDK